MFGGPPYKGNEGARRQFPKEPLKGTRITFLWAWP